MDEPSSPHINFYFRDDVGQISQSVHMTSTQGISRVVVTGYVSVGLLTLATK